MTGLCHENTILLQSQIPVIQWIEMIRLSCGPFFRLFLQTLAPTFLLKPSKVGKWSRKQMSSCKVKSWLQQSSGAAHLNNHPQSSTIILKEQMPVPIKMPFQTLKRITFHSLYTLLGCRCTFTSVCVVEEDKSTPVVVVQQWQQSPSDGRPELQGELALCLSGEAGRH